MLVDGIQRKVNLSPRIDSVEQVRLETLHIRRGPGSRQGIEPSPRESAADKRIQHPAAVRRKRILASEPQRVLRETATEARRWYAATRTRATTACALAAQGEQASDLAALEIPEILQADHRLVGFVGGVAARHAVVARGTGAVAVIERLAGAQGCHVGVVGAHAGTAVFRGGQAEKAVAAYIVVIALRGSTGMGLRGQCGSCMRLSVAAVECTGHRHG